MSGSASRTVAIAGLGLASVAAMTVIVYVASGGGEPPADDASAAPLAERPPSAVVPVPAVAAPAVPAMPVPPPDDVVAADPDDAAARRQAIDDARAAGVLGGVAGGQLGGGLGGAAPTSGLDRDVIQRVMKRSMTKFRLCYERALVDEPTLGGTVRSSFTIDRHGRVVNATATGVSPGVAGCVAAAIETLEFPPPAGGGVVKINYPFRFSNAP